MFQNKTSSLHLLSLPCPNWISIKIKYKFTSPRDKAIGKYFFNGSVLIYPLTTAHFTCRSDLELRRINLFDNLKCFLELIWNWEGLCFLKQLKGFLELICFFWKAQKCSRINLEMRRINVLVKLKSSLFCCFLPHDMVSSLHCSPHVRLSSVSFPTS